MQEKQMESSSKSKVFAKILYRTYSDPSILQEFNYEGYDLPPECPYFDQFMTYWNENIPSTILEIKGFCKELNVDNYVHLPETFTVN
tara:strand:+ start:252 stop:512 length:261 start_codon:yes stop_codon:yes gene_type:complete